MGLPSQEEYTRPPGAVHAIARTLLEPPVSTLVTNQQVTTAALTQFAGV